MNEEQVIDKVSMIDQWKVSGDSYTQGELDAIGQLLELYYDNKKQLKQEKEKNKELEEKCKEVICVPKGTCFLLKPKDVISKDKIKAEMEDIIDYFEYVNATSEDMEFLEKKKKELLEEK